MGMRVILIAFISTVMITGIASAGPLISGDAVDEMVTERPF